MRCLSFLVVNIFLICLVLLCLCSLVLLFHDFNLLLALLQEFYLVLSASLQNFLKFLFFAELVVLDALDDVKLLKARLVEENVVALDGHRLFERIHPVALHLVLADLAEHNLLHRELHILQLLEELQNLLPSFNDFGLSLLLFFLPDLLDDCPHLFL